MVGTESLSYRSLKDSAQFPTISASFPSISFIKDKNFRTSDENKISVL